LFLFWNLWNFLFNKLYGLRLHGEILRTLLKCFGIDFWNDSISITVKYLMFETLVDFCIEELNTLDVLIFCEVEKLIFIWLIICHLPNIFVFIEIHHSIRLFPQKSSSRIDRWIIITSTAFQTKIIMDSSTI
jgi:hypothetical protein